MDRELNRLSKELADLGRSLQQDFAPVLGAGDDLSLWTSWDDVPALDAVAMNWAEIAIIGDDLSRLYRWLTAGLLGAGGSETEVWGDIPLSQPPPLPGGPRPFPAATPLSDPSPSVAWPKPKISEDAEAVRSLSGPVAAPKSPMEGSSRHHSRGLNWFDGHTRQTGSNEKRWPNSDDPSFARNAGSSPLIQRELIQQDQAQGMVITPSPSAAMDPIVGGFQDLAARLAGSSGLDRIYPSEVESAEVGDLVDGVHPTGMVVDTGIPDEQPSDRPGFTVPIAGGLTEVAAQMANGVGAIHKEPWPNDRTGPRPIVQSDQHQTIATMTYNSPTAMAPIASGLAELAAQLTGIETHQADLVHDNPYQDPIQREQAAMARVTVDNEVEEAQFSGSQPYTLENSRNLCPDAAHNPTTRGESSSGAGVMTAKYPGEPVGWLTPPSTASSMVWPEAQTLDDRDLDDIMDEIAHTIIRDYHRFYGP